MGVLRRVAIISVVLLLLTASLLLLLSLTSFMTPELNAPPQQTQLPYAQDLSLQTREDYPVPETTRPKISQSLISELDEKESTNAIVQLKREGNKENAKKKRYELSRKLHQREITATENAIGNTVTVPITQEQLASLASEKDIESVHPDRIFYALLAESTASIGAATAWENSHTGEGVRVAILDTGVNGSDVHLAKSFTGNDASDDNGHGTIVAAAIMAIAPKAELLNAKVLDNTGRGLESSIISGINWAADNKADVIVLSLGGPYSDIDSPLNRAVKEASEQGIAVVAAAGNCGKEGTSTSCGGYVGVTTPGNSPYAITVGAVDRQGNHAAFSSGERTRGITKPDITAPGVGVIIDGKEYSGTSISTAIAAGAAAVVSQAVPNIKPAQLKAVLAATSTDLGEEGKDTKFGSGVVNLTTAALKIKEAGEIYGEAQQEEPTGVRDLGVINLDLIAPEPLPPEITALEPTESNIKITLADRKGIVGILLEIIDGDEPSYTIGEEVTIEMEETLGYSQLGGKNQIYDYCDLIAYLHATEEHSGPPERGKLRDSMPAGSGPWKITLTFTVLSEHEGPGEFQAWVWCSGNGGSPQYSWKGSPGRFNWEGIPPSDCTPEDPSVSILWVQGTSSSVDYELKVYNDLCKDYDSGYSRYVDTKEYSSVIMVPPIAPKGSRSDTGSIKDTFSEGSHTFKACLSGGGDCEEEDFLVGTPCTDNPGVVDACLNNPAGSHCDGAAECQNPYCVQNFCSANPWYCGNGHCEQEEDHDFCPDDCENIICNSNAGCGTDGFVDNNHCDADENVHRTYRSYTCQNPGTPQSSCKDEDSDKIIKICGIGCSNGACKESIACKSEKDCKSAGWTGTPTCSGNDIYQSYLTPKCIKPGQTTSSCEYTSTPTKKETCKEGCEEGSCTSEQPYTIQLENSDWNTIHKQPGDFIAFKVYSWGKQKISFTYPDELIPVEGSVLNGKASVEKGWNKLKFYIPEDTEKQSYLFTGTTVKDVLAKAHSLANDNQGVVYDLSEENLGPRPWKNFEDYDESIANPKYTDNSYSLSLSSFIQRKCNKCHHTILLGDDFVLPYYRRDTSQWTGLKIPVIGWLWKSKEIESIYTDNPFISTSSPDFNDLDQVFSTGGVYIVTPDYLSEDDVYGIKQALVEIYGEKTLPFTKPCLGIIEEGTYLPDYMKNCCGCVVGNPELKAQDKITVYASSDVTCNSFAKLDKRNLILIGNATTNNAIACLPWVAETTFPQITIQRNVWDGNKHAVVINTNQEYSDLATTVFAHIVQKKQWREFADGDGLNLIDIGVTVAGFIPYLDTPVDAYQAGDSIFDFQSFSLSKMGWCVFDGAAVLLPLGTSYAKTPANAMEEVSELSHTTGNPKFGTLAGRHGPALNEYGDLAHTYKKFDEFINGIKLNIDDIDEAVKKNPRSATHLFAGEVEQLKDPFLKDFPIHLYKKDGIDFWIGMGKKVEVENVNKRTFGRLLFYADEADIKKNPDLIVDTGQKFAGKADEISATLRKAEKGLALEPGSVDVITIGRGDTGFGYLADGRRNLHLNRLALSHNFNDVKKYTIYHEATHAKLRKTPSFFEDKITDDFFKAMPIEEKHSYV
ncbi:S8 family serine peptidase, partial [Candidatus Woesearchaeota archaeon]|nr:S8 family serine peptidase [Candidatus Woesearchaeota archaeon]